MRRRKCPLQSAIVVVIDQRTKISMKNMSSCEKSRTPSPSAAVGGCRVQNESRAAAGLTARRNCDVGLTSTWFEAALLDVNRLQRRRTFDFQYEEVSYQYSRSFTAIRRCLSCWRFNCQAVRNDNMPNSLPRNAPRVKQRHRINGRDTVAILWIHNTT